MNLHAFQACKFKLKHEFKLHKIICSHKKWLFHIKDKYGFIVVTNWITLDNWVKLCLFKL